MSTLRVLVVPPFAPPQVAVIPHTLYALQACVGGDLECWAIDDHVAIYCHEEGRVLGLPYNRRVTLDDGATESFVGPLLLVGHNPDTGESESLTDADLAQWTQRLLHPAQPEIRRSTRFHRQTPYGRRTTVTLKFDVNARITPASARAWARSVARDWGSINWETHYSIPQLDGWIGSFGCSGHGGYIVVTADAPNAWARFANEGAACHPQPEAFHGATVYVFEEDCDWAALEASLPALADQVLRRRLKARAQSVWLTPNERATAQHTLANSTRYAEQRAAHQATIARVLAEYLPDWAAPTKWLSA